MSKSYIVILQYLWCNETGGGIEYTSDCVKFDKRDEAIRHGFKLRESDDFNIGVIEDGKLISFDWMDTLRRLKKLESIGVVKRMESSYKTQVCWSAA